ncbi:superoxide dismutase [Aquabacterium sp. A7-Y]|uniref:superoxide dismutase n=1 Tax=Aquabacterium sp. A7-Y TaxID=1349605 RepID=UPI00223DF887|nr:superoxide dismutase [Aquabacterium sp. A7-Y]MCW7539748.1 superoxide dismutase [Aquabacterium sp. A7-Y]
MHDIDCQRRRFFALGAAAFGLPLAAAELRPAAPAASAAAPAKSASPLPPLPWQPSALEPVISARTIGFHYDKHHRGYVDNLARAIKGTRYEGLSLERVVQASAVQPTERAIFNHAAQDWNHRFFWHSLSPRGGGKPPREVQILLDDSFGSFEAFRSQFLKAATGLFGSGWLWLVQDPVTRRLELLQTSNADTPVVQGSVLPLAVLDVWEHAYYIDYQNRRPAYVEAVFDKLWNWRFVESNLAQVARA